MLKLPISTDLIENNANLVVMSAQRLNAASKLVAYVELVGVKEQDNAIDAFGEPLEDAGKVVAAVDALLLPGENARRVDDGDLLQNGAGHVGALQSVEEGVAKLGQRAKLPLRVDDQGVAGDDALLFAVHHRNEAVGCRLGADANAGKVALQQVANEGGLAGAVLADQQNHRLRVKVGILKGGRVKVVKEVLLLEGQNLGAVDALQALDDVLVQLAVLLALTIAEKGEHGGSGGSVVVVVVIQ